MSDSNLVKYGTYEADAADQEEAELVTGDFFRCKVGMNVVRILPPKAGLKSPFLIFSQHYVKIPGGTRAVRFACPRIAKSPCPVCDYADRLRSSGNAADMSKADSMFPRKNIVTNLIARKTPDRGPLIYEFGKMVHNGMAAIRKASPGTEMFGVGGDFTHPVTGFDLAIVRVGTGKEDTKYAVKPANVRTPLHPDAKQMQAWIDGARDLSGFARIRSVDEIGAMLRGGGGGGSAPAQEASAEDFGFGGGEGASPGFGGEQGGTAQDAIFDDMD